jgi:hypothetical protein
VTAADGEPVMASRCIIPGERLAAVIAARCIIPGERLAAVIAARCRIQYLVSGRQQ